ncbi:MAG: PEP-CTERM/exosortase system-associated acyltransferase, partial [Onishia taeanensis]
RLPRLLSRSGFHFAKSGETINFHGTRSAFYIDHSKAEEEVSEKLLPLYHDIKKRLSIQKRRQATKEESAEYNI